MSNEHADNQAVAADLVPEGDDLEAAYLRALNALENAEDAFQDVIEEAAADLSDVADLTSDVEEASSVSVGGNLDAVEEREPADLEPQPDGEHNVSPLQIIESALFVGGNSLTTKNLRTLFRGDVTTDDLVELIDQLNQMYVSENRPYEVQLHEGGYVLQLREEYQSLRRKVFGLGPREVKLTQEALEVLSLVAYHQPITKDEIEGLGKDKPNGTLRHLLRRQLIQIERCEDGGEVHYRTTDRFLDLLAIEDLEDLPRAEALMFR
ncbi:MAG: SMC-Scp complex subunit ScpB [Planctomycetaceae bacterium]